MQSSSGQSPLLVYPHSYRIGPPWVRRGILIPSLESEKEREGKRWMHPKTVTADSYRDLRVKTRHLPHAQFRKLCVLGESVKWTTVY